MMRLFFNKSLTQVNMAEQSLLEVCVDNIISVRNAFNGGADRIELCSSLAEDGLTPSLGFLKAARKTTSPFFPIFAMIRPRGGNFVYDDIEVEIMENDIRNLKEGGANGFVFGLLTKEQKIDVTNCKRLLESAKPLPSTFHRAFDQIMGIENQDEALDAIIELGFTRLLTSGGSETAERGLQSISRLHKRSAGRLIVMPGKGVSRGNLRIILDTCGLMEFHGSAKDELLDRDNEISVTSEAVVRDMKAIAIAPYL